MRIDTLRLTDFRNLVETSLQFSPGLNVFIGRNGQGKTNLLEAIHLLGLVRSFRTSKLAETVRWGQEEASVHAKANDRLGTFEVGVAIGKGRTRAYLNGDRVSSAAKLAGKVLCVGFAPGDLGLVKGGPQGRREFVDKHLTDLYPSLFVPVVNYHRALRHKNALLKEENVNSSALEPWDRLLAAEAVKLAAGKRTFIRRLEERAVRIHERFSAPEDVFSLRLETGVREEWKEDDLLDELRRLRSREIASRSCLLGPHKDDLVVTLGGREARAFASQGQTRSIVLSLKLGVIELLEQERQEPPLVLLDDVDSELDQERADAFFRMLLEHERQVFITGTTAYAGILSNHPSCSMFQVREGRISSITR